MERVYNPAPALELSWRCLPSHSRRRHRPHDEELLLDQLKLQQLEARWTELYATVRDIRSSGWREPGNPTGVHWSSCGAPRSKQTLSLAVALFAALIGLIAIERGRGIMWADKDLEEGPPVIVELPSRPLRSSAIRPTSRGTWILPAAVAKPRYRCCEPSWAITRTRWSPSRPAASSVRTCVSSLRMWQSLWLCRGGASC